MPAPWRHPSRIPFTKTGCRHSFRVFCPDTGTTNPCECRAAYGGVPPSAGAPVTACHSTISMSSRCLRMSLAVPPSGQLVSLTSDVSSPRHSVVDQSASTPGPLTLMRWSVRRDRRLGAWGTPQGSPDTARPRLAPPSGRCETRTNGLAPPNPPLARCGPRLEYPTAEIRRGS